MLLRHFKSSPQSAQFQSLPFTIFFYYSSTHFSGHLCNAPSVLGFRAFNMPVLNCHFVCHIIYDMGPRIEKSQKKPNFDS